ncbi:DUF3784 domain-containing protein [Clostridium bowmanii]|uniref:DUF3784 domain-containing protein n=1 Tax=Clostridium bowmanii TaxID=132925 RepID=UPI001C0D45AA|nr:DUF3784 domain-containing protein [Clostridium bowmanii]MBU3191518.1 DUF3784 domain-containing protein [Clostridium bowmanii]MCA1075884.1 DUF3784 domain-containing protein [Clostridium bowmanii]
MIIVAIIDVLFFSILGICLIYGKGSWMISGYNAMSEEEKENCNIMKISRAVGIFLLIIGGLIGVMCFVVQYGIKNDIKNITGYAVGLVTFVAIVGSIILIIILQKFDVGF